MEVSANPAIANIHSNIAQAVQQLPSTAVATRHRIKQGGDNAHLDSLELNSTTSVNPDRDPHGSSPAWSHGRFPNQDDPDSDGQESARRPEEFPAESDGSNHLDIEG